MKATYTFQNKDFSGISQFTVQAKTVSADFNIPTTSWVMLPEATFLKKCRQFIRNIWYDWFWYQDAGRLATIL